MKTRKNLYFNTSPTDGEGQPEEAKTEAEAELG